MASLERRDGRFDEALSHLDAAAGLADDLDLPGERWRALAALAALHDELDNTSEAESARTRAEEIVHLLAETFSDDADGIRGRFVAGPLERIRAAH